MPAASQWRQVRGTVRLPAEGRNLDGRRQPCHFEGIGSNNPLHLFTVLGLDDHHAAKCIARIVQDRPTDQHT